MPICVLVGVWCRENGKITIFVAMNSNCANLNINSFQFRYRGVTVFLLWINRDLSGVDPDPVSGFETRK